MPFPEDNGEYTLDNFAEMISKTQEKYVVYHSFLHLQRVNNDSNFSEEKLYLQDIFEDIIIKKRQDFKILDYISRLTIINFEDCDGYIILDCKYEGDYKEEHRFIIYHRNPDKLKSVADYFLTEDN